MIRAGGCWPDISVATFPAIPPSSCRTCRALQVLLLRIILSLQRRALRWLRIRRHCGSIEPCSAGHQRTSRADLRRFGWVGGTSLQNRLCVALTSSPVKTIDDLFTTPLTVGTNGPGSVLQIIPNALNATSSEQSSTSRRVQGVYGCDNLVSGRARSMACAIWQTTSWKAPIEIC